MKLSALLALLLAFPGMASEIALPLGGAATGPGSLVVESSLQGSDDLAIVSEGEWSCGQLTLATREASADAPLTVRVRLTDTAKLAGRPALVRRGPLTVGGVTKVVESWIATCRRDGDDVVAELPYPPVAGVEDRYDLVDIEDSVEWSNAPTLTEAGGDQAPLGRRRALILVHGDSGAAGRPIGAKLSTFDAFRGSKAYRELAGSYKTYLYRFPVYRSARENGESLAKLIARKLPAAQLAFVAHGTGALVMRHAAAGALAKRTGLMISFAGAHHGSILASLAYANERAAERLGVEAYRLVKLGHPGMPGCPGLESAAFDNYDGTLDPQDADALGLRLNPELAAFDVVDPNLAKLVCLHGDVDTLSAKPERGVAPDELRAAVALLHPVFANSDPVVPFGSGVFEGSSRHQVHTYPDVDHAGIVANPAAWADAVAHLAENAGVPGSSARGAHGTRQSNPIASATQRSR